MANGLDEDLEEIMRLAKKARYRFLQRNLLLEVKMSIEPALIAGYDGLPVDPAEEDEFLRSAASMSSSAPSKYAAK